MEKKPLIYTGHKAWWHHEAAWALQPCLETNLDSQAFQFTGQITELYTRKNVS
jgi:hypothetical protein